MVSQDGKLVLSQLRESREDMHNLVVNLAQFFIYVETGDGGYQTLQARRDALKPRYDPGMLPRKTPDYDDRVDWVHHTYVPAITNMATPANTVSLSMTPKDYLLMRVTQLDHCIGCRHPLAGGGYQLEHSVPRSRGGENSVKACSLMCGTEHGCKTARDNSTVRRGFDAIRQVHWYASMARALRMPIDDGGITFPWAIERD